MDWSKRTAGDRLRHAVKLAGLDGERLQNEAARRCGIKSGPFSRMLADAKLVSQREPSTLLSVANGLGVSVAWLTRGEGSPRDGVRHVDTETDPPALAALRQDPDTAGWPDAVWASLRTFATMASEPLPERALFAAGSALYAQVRGKAVPTRVVEDDEIEAARATRKRDQ